MDSPELFSIYIFEIVWFLDFDGFYAYLHKSLWDFWFGNIKVPKHDNIYV